VRAWLEGDWSVVEGAYFDCWRHEQHVVQHLRGAAPLGPVPIDGLGLGKTVLSGLVGDRLR
jgi:hypothetical protein